MARKPLGKDKFGVQKVMHIGDYFTDSLGMFALNILSGLVGQLTYFYTDKVGLAAGAVATLFLIAKVFDAFTDLIMGNIVDHTPPGKEKYRPWLLKMSFPAAILVVLLFTVPRTVPAVQLAYMFITNILLTAVIYTAISIPYSSLMVVRTNSQEERGNMGIWRSASSYISGMIIVICIIPITNAMGGTQSAWIKFGFIAGVCVLLTLLICYKFSKEVAVDNKVSTAAIELGEEDDEEPVPFKEAIVKLLHNKYWVIVLFLGLLANITYGLTNTSGAYYCKWIFGDDNLMAVLGTVGMLPTILGFVLVGPMIKRWGVVKTLRISFFLGAVSNIARIFVAYDFWPNTILGCVATFANIPMMCLLGVMTAMAIDYNKYVYDKKMVACSQSASSFGGKVGNGLGASMVGWCLAIAGYTATVEVATEATKQAIFAFSIYIPFVVFAIMFVLSMMFDLEPKLPAIREEIAKRKEQK